VSGPLPEVAEHAPNGTRAQAQLVTLPHIISGCIAHPGDSHFFRFTGHAGDEVVAEVYARRLGSPLDSLLRLSDAAGHVLAWNDDFPDKEVGLLTHQADSYLSAKLPATGTYYVQIFDAQGHGGADYTYNLRIGPRQADFALRLSPSCLNVPAGGTVPVTVTAIRKDGWDGEIRLSLQNAPAGFVLSGTRIPAGRDRVRITLTAPRGLFSQPLALQCVGQALIGGQTVTRPVVPAENMMQAFAYYHLVPAQQLLAMVTRGGRNRTIVQLANNAPLRIPANGKVQLAVTMQPKPNTPIQLALSDPPAGITLQEVTDTFTGVTFTLAADDKHVGYAENLIIEAFTEQAGKSQKGPTARQQRVSLGILPAIPFEIVHP
jgi:hypothetical protein